MRQHYAAFRPQRQARLVGLPGSPFLSVGDGLLQLRPAGGRTRNLAYLESVVREVAAAGRPVVVAEFGWYGGGKLTIDGGRHPDASEEDQARWCRRGGSRSARCGRPAG